MKLIKLALLSVIILFIVSLLISLLIPSQVRVSRAVNLESGQDDVLHYIADTTQWPAWHPGWKNDSGRRPVTGTRIMAHNDSVLVMQLQQAGKRPVTSAWQIHRYPATDSVTLQWYMDFTLGWLPWQKFSSLFFEATYGTMIEEGLTNLKRTRERGKFPG
ncbi:MAG TPA: hypothetical protein VFZ78_09100 [Flavisolibacter sp.]